jgi:hypothetical protein
LNFADTDIYLYSATTAVYAKTFHKQNDDTGGARSEEEGKSV